MEILKLHPKKSKWKVFAYQYAGNGQDRYVDNGQGIYNQPYIWFDGTDATNAVDGWHERPKAALWDRDNFIFRATMQYSHLETFRAGCHAICFSEDLRYKFVFIPRTFDKTMQLVRTRRFHAGTTPVFSGTFTFEKTGTSMFCSPYTDPL